MAEISIETTQEYADPDWFVAPFTGWYSIDFRWTGGKDPSVYLDEGIPWQVRGREVITGRTPLDVFATTNATAFLHHSAGAYVNSADQTDRAERLYIWLESGDVFETPAQVFEAHYQGDRPPVREFMTWWNSG